MPARPIIVVTGANSGVGFGICHRLLIQLASKIPPDAQANWLTPNNPTTAEIAPCEGLTLIMACRSISKAEAARQKLRKILERHATLCKQSKDYDGHAERFAANVDIELLYLDLAVVHSIFQCAKEIIRRYPYVSHLICNAGVASFTGMDWAIIFRQILSDPMGAVTSPEYYMQNAGEMSVDGLGWIWQCNVFGHYVLYRSLQSALSSSTCPLGARVLWTSSVEASPKFYDSNDWQLIKTNHSYESSKYHIDLIGTHLDRQCIAQRSNNDKTTIRHFVVQPGVASTNISNALVNYVLDYVKIILFYFARWYGSPYHTVTALKAAVAPVHLALLPLTWLATLSTAVSMNGKATNGGANGHAPTVVDKPVRYGSQTRRNGEEYVGVTSVKAWETHQDEGLRLLQKCEQLYGTFVKAEGWSSVETASERM